VIAVRTRHRFLAVAHAVVVGVGVVRIGADLGFVTIRQAVVVGIGSLVHARLAHAGVRRLVASRRGVRAVVVAQALHADVRVTVEKAVRRRHRALCVLHAFADRDLGRG
jgi:acyl dehydratase